MAIDRGSDFPVDFDESERRTFHHLCDALLAFLMAHERARERRRMGMNPPIATAPSERNPPNQAAPTREKLLLTVHEAAKILEVCARTVGALSHPHGPIPVVRIGRLVRYAPEDLKAFIASRRSNSSRKDPEHED